ncbi:MAG: 16S rRNA (guanine(966)-N(2))-methyltransferase RsmD [Acidobacteriota bacterium]
MRIIGGEFRGRTLAAVPKSGVRPTADPVREALFNILGQQLDGRCFVDLAAGTGAVGLEAYSRGARPVALVEKDRGAIQTIRRNIERLEGGGAPLQGLILVHSDVAKWLRSEAFSQLPRVDLVFVDPPYGFPTLGSWLEALGNTGCLTDESLVVVEHRSGDPPQPPPGFQTAWTRRYGDSGLTALGLA